MNVFRNARRAPLVFALVLLPLALAPSAEARVDVTLDAASLNDLIANMTPERVPVKLAGDRSVDILLHDLKVTGFDPAGGPAGEGVVLTTVRLEVPALGLDLPVAPKLSLQFREANGRHVAYLRFEQVKIELALMGPIDVAPLLPLLPITTDTAWTVGSQRGAIRVEPKLVDARLGAKNLRLGFDLDVAPAAMVGAGAR